MRKIRIAAFSILLLFASSFFATSLFAQVRIVEERPPLTYHVFKAADLGLTGPGGSYKDIRIYFDPGPTGQHSIEIQVENNDTSMLLVDGETDQNDYETEIQGSYYVGQIDDHFGGDFDLTEEADAAYNTVLATGRVPRGSYRITVTLLDAGGLPVGSSASVVVTVFPPYMTPQTPVNMQTDSASLNFAWTTNIFDQELRLFFDPSGNNEVLAGSRGPYKVPNKGSSFVLQQYTVNGSIISPVLTDSMMYYWQIEGSINTTHGNERKESVLTAFQYFEGMRTVLGALYEYDEDAIMDLLIQLILQVMGGEKGDPGKAAVRTLESLGIDRIVHDNVPATGAYIQSVLQSILDGEAQVTSIRLQ
jgi:hypothetical protein